MTEIVAHFLDSHGEPQCVPWPFAAPDPQRALRERRADFRALLEKITPDARPRGIPDYDPTDNGEVAVSPVRLPGLP